MRYSFGKKKLSISLLAVLCFPCYGQTAQNLSPVKIASSVPAASEENKKQQENKLTAEEVRVKKLELLMEQARQAMVKNDYRSAIQRYTQVTQFEGTDFFQAALEYLGLARERNQQFAHAKAEYERYLKLFPNTEGALRVQQRLNALLTASFQPRKRLRKSRRSIRANGWRNSGSMMQFFRRDMDLIQTANDNNLSSNAYSSFYYTSRLKTPGYDMKNRVSMSNNYDFDENDEDNNKIKISTFYSELHSKKMKLSSRVGRQTQNSSGAYGRFDGGVVTYHYNPRLSLRAVSGYLVDFDTYDTIQTNKYFYSANIEMESLFSYLDVNTYFITQYYDDVLDRQAIGLELRHFDRKTSFFTTLDYDFSYALVNNFVVNLRYKIKPKHTLGTYLTYRRSPLITTSNALQGQAVSTLGELLITKTQDELRKLAQDRTAKYISANVSWQHKLNKKLEMNYDYTLSRLSGTVSSDGIVGAEGTGLEHYISTQLIANNLIRQYDVSIIGLRLEKRFNSDRVNVNMLRRDRINFKFTVSSKFRADYQKRTGNIIFYDFRPSAKINYKASRKYKFEFEVGVQHRIRKNSLDASRETNGFFSLGYIWNF